MTQVVALTPRLVGTANADRGNDWLSRKEAATYLASIGCPVSVRTLEKKASNNNEGRGPSFTRVGWRTVKYQRRDLDIWAAMQSKRVL